MEKKRSYSDILAEKRTWFAKQRTIYAEERTFLALIRTVATVLGLLIVVAKFYFVGELYTDMVLVLLSIVSLAIILERLHEFHKRKDKMKNLEERLS